VGALWENYLISERLKTLHYRQIWSNVRFWRTFDQQEIDYLEETDGTLLVWEFKWNPQSKARVPKAFADTYPNHLTRGNGKRGFRRDLATYPILQQLDQHGDNPGLSR